MKQIVPPACDSCGDTAKFESELAGQYCYICLRDSATFMQRRNLLESNPLCEILFAGVWRTTDSTYEIAYGSPHHEHAWSFLWITYENR